MFSAKNVNLRYCIDIYNLQSFKKSTNPLTGKVDKNRLAEEIG